MTRGPGSGAIPVERSAEGLEPGKAYYWTVIAEDSRAGTVESMTRRFELE